MKCPNCQAENLEGMNFLVAEKVSKDALFSPKITRFRLTIQFFAAEITLDFHPTY
jgi:hypothetical protein